MLILNNKFIDSSIEHEIINESGMKVEIQFIHNKTEIFEDITEIHWMYDPQRVALESNIAGTGWTYSTNWIHSISIVDQKTPMNELIDKIKNIWIKAFKCYFSGHLWVTPISERDYKLDEIMIKEWGVIKAFDYDIQMYCKRCGHYSKYCLNTNLTKFAALNA